MREVQLYNKMRGSLNPCSFCKHNILPDSQNWYGACYDCVGDYSKFELSDEARQFFSRTNYEIKEKIPEHNTIIVLGFPGVGKSKATEILRERGFRVSDSDSSMFPKDGFPDNYIQHIKECCLHHSFDIMFISSHEVVRKSIFNSRFLFNNFPIYICYPDKKLKDEYICRYKERGNNEKFIELLSENFEKWIDDIEKESYFYPLKLSYKDANLMSVLYKLPRNFYNRNSHEHSQSDKDNS
jgi:hypothetical protein